MFNLNRIISFVKQHNKHNLKSTECINAYENRDEQLKQQSSTLTNNTSANKTKKFIFIKRNKSTFNRIQSSQNNIKTSASLHLISDTTDKKQLNNIPNSVTLDNLAQEIKTSPSTSITSSIRSESEFSIYKKGKEQFIQNNQNSSITSEIYTLEQMYNDNNIYSELNDMCNDFLETQSNAEIRIVHNKLLSNYSTIMNNNCIDVKVNQETGSGTDSCSSCSSSCYSSESEDEEFQQSMQNKNQLKSRSQMSLNKSISSNVSNISKLKSILVKKNTPHEEDDKKSISDYFGESISIKKIDEKIRFKLAGLRVIALKLNITIPAHLSMVETLYDMKMNHLKEETKECLKQFDKKVLQDQQEKSKNFNKFLNTTTKLLKSYGLRRRAKSVDGKINNNETNNKLADKNDQKRKLDCNTTTMKHKNYYSLERDNLERKYENQMRLIQFEILNSINAIELQFQEIKRQRNIEQERHKQKCNDDCCKPQQIKDLTNNNEQNSNVRQFKVHYSTQVSLQKRIQNRLKKKKQQLNLIKLLNSSSRESLVDVGISKSTFNGDVSLIDTTDLQKYRNPNSIETMV